VCGIPGGEAATINFKSGDRRGCENDEARSARLFGLPAGTTFTVFDSPNGNWSDDYTTVRVLKDLKGRSVTIPSFHTSYSSGDMAVQARYRNGLDGKISRIVVVPAP